MVDNDDAPKKLSVRDAPKKRKLKKSTSFGLTKKERKLKVAEKRMKRLLKTTASPEALDTNPGGPKEHAACTPPAKGQTQAHSSTEVDPKDESGGLRLAVDLLATLPHHVWWRALQDPDATMDVSTGTRQDWSVIMPVFIKAGLFCVPQVGKSTKLQFNESRWDKVCTLMDTVYYLDFKYTRVRRKHERWS